MVTVSIQVKNVSFAHLLKKIYNGHNSVVSVSLSENKKEKNENYALPGPPMMLQEFKKKIKEAEKSNFISNEEMKTIIEGWINS